MFTFYKWLCFVIGNIVLILVAIVVIGKIYAMLRPVRRYLLGIVKRTYVSQWYERYINWPRIEKEIRSKENNYEKEQWLDQLKKFVTENVRMKTNKYKDFYVGRIDLLTEEYNASK